MCSVQKSEHPLASEKRTHISCEDNGVFAVHSSMLFISLTQITGMGGAGVPWSCFPFLKDRITFVCRMLVDEAKKENHFGQSEYTHFFNSAFGQSIK
jgi:hypothetical protein